MTAFKRFHPASLALYFFAVLSVTVFSQNLIFSSLSFAASFLICIVFTSPKSLVKTLVWNFLLIAAISATNPLFSRSGATVLFYIGNIPFTREALLYGFNAGLGIICVINWYIFISMVFTSDKLLYLLGGSFPVTALTLTAALRFIPLFNDRIRNAAEIQRAMGIYEKKRLKTVMRIFSIMLTNAFENALQTAQSMVARGYSSSKSRTSFSLFRFRIGDFFLSISSVFSLSAVIFSAARGYIGFEFYPLTVCRTNTPGAVVYCVFAIFLTLPLLSGLKEWLRWNYFRSRG